MTIAEHGTILAQTRTRSFDVLSYENYVAPGLDSAYFSKILSADVVHYDPWSANKSDSMLFAARRTNSQLYNYLTIDQYNNRTLINSEISVLLRLLSFSWIYIHSSFQFRHSPMSNNPVSYTLLALVHICHRRKWNANFFDFCGTPEVNLNLVTAPGHVRYRTVLWTVMKDTKQAGRAQKRGKNVAVNFPPRQTPTLPLSILGNIIRAGSQLVSTATLHGFNVFHQRSRPSGPFRRSNELHFISFDLSSM